jgi:hypothetical protein
MCIDLAAERHEGMKRDSVRARSMLLEHSIRICLAAMSGGSVHLIFRETTILQPYVSIQHLTSIVLNSPFNGQF